MLDKTYLLVPSKNEHHYHTNETTIIEKKAPTDESIKLLRKMEKEARKQVEKSIRVTDTSFDCNILMQSEYWNAEYCIIIMYTLNGNKRRVETRVSSHFEKNELYQEIGKAVLDSVAKDISENVLNSLSHTVTENLLKYKQ